MICCVDGGDVGAGPVETCNKSSKCVKKGTMEMGNGGGKIGLPEPEDGERRKL